MSTTLKDFTTHPLQRSIHQLDIIIPCHNEEEVIASTHERLTRILRDLLAQGKIGTYTLIFVDNGSTDHTLARLMLLFHQDPHTQVVSLRSNFGYQGSISAGLFHSSGDAAITIDADLQDPPEYIPAMIEKYEEGFDLVLGIRADRKTDTRFKRWTAQWYYSLLRALHVPIVPHHGDFRLMAKELVQIFNELPERNRFIRAMVLHLDHKYALIPYERASRTAGHSKFGIKNLFSLGIDGITSFIYTPLRIAGILGAIFFILSLAGIGFVLYEKYAYDIVRGWASILCFLLFFNGMQFLFLGLLGEYIGKMYGEIKRRPLFIVRKTHKHLKDKN